MDETDFIVVFILFLAQPYLKVHLHEIFFPGFLLGSSVSMPKNRACEYICFHTSIYQHIKICLSFGSDDMESHSPSIESMPSETPCRLSQCRMRLHSNEER
jgi:hypothetical protein